RYHEAVQRLADGVDAVQGIDRHVVIHRIGGEETEQLVDVLAFPGAAKIAYDSFGVRRHGGPPWFWGGLLHPATVTESGAVAVSPAGCATLRAFAGSVAKEGSHDLRKCVGA